MSRILTFYGASDDLFEIEGTAGNEPDEFSPPNDEPGVVKVYDRFGNGLIVTGIYTGTGVWSIGIAPMDEDQPIPDWEIRFQRGPCGYSARMTLVAPDDAVVERVSS